MQAIFRSAVALALSFSIGLIVLPLATVSPIVQPGQKADCCAGMPAGHVQKDCGKKMPKSAPDRQCCAACAAGLALIVGVIPRVIISRSNGNAFSLTDVVEDQRSERPPVPPPRCAVV